MPIMDGAAAIEAARTIDPLLKVIVASGSALDGIANGTNASTICAVLEKPYTPEKLLTTIDKVLRAPR
jgi:CheY-like chemotaxis protein